MNDNTKLGLYFIVLGVASVCFGVFYKIDTTKSPVGTPKYAARKSAKRKCIAIGVAVILAGIAVLVLNLAQ